MKVINCGIVVYLITLNHIARIEYKLSDGIPTAWIYYDNELEEGISAENGMTMKIAYEFARKELRRKEYFDSKPKYSLMGGMFDFVDDFLGTL